MATSKVKNEAVRNWKYQSDAPTNYTSETLFADLLIFFWKIQKYKFGNLKKKLFGFKLGGQKIVLEKMMKTKVSSFYT